MKEETKNKIEKYISENKIFLFMKGDPTSPQCGFSYRVVAMLEDLNVDFASFNVLEDQDIREGVKEFTNWPTIPQLYVRGEFIGGCDIVEELFSNGELEKLVKN